MRELPRFLIWPIFFFFAIGLGQGQGNGDQSDNDTSSRPRQARVIGVKGEVLIQRPNGGLLFKARKEDFLYEDDLLRTDSEATLLVELPHKGRLKLAGGSVLKIEKLPSLADQKERAQGRFELSKGHAFLQLPEKTYNPETWIDLGSTRLKSEKGLILFTKGEDDDPRDLWVVALEGIVSVLKVGDTDEENLKAGEGMLVEKGLYFTKPFDYNWPKNLNSRMNEDDSLHSELRSPASRGQRLEEFEAHRGQLRLRARKEFKTLIDGVSAERLAPPSLPGSPR